MKQDTFLDLLGILGLLSAPSVFIEILNSYIRYTATIFGVLALGIYIKFYYDNKIIKLIDNNKESIENNKKELINMDKKIEKIKGWIEATQHFFPFKNRKGAIDPIILITILIIIIIIIIWIQKGGQ